MIKRLLWIIPFAALVLALSLVGASAAPPSAEEFYARAVAQMRRYPEPTFASYDASISGLNCYPDGAGFDCTLGPSTAKSERPFAVDLRESDGRAALRKAGRSVVLGDSTFVNATWPGVDAIIRRGFIGMASAPNPTPSPVESSPGPLHVIAEVSALSVENYFVYDEGAESCAAGDAGHAVRLVARRDPRRYPLTGATIDLRTGDLCAVRFNAKVDAAAGLVGATAGARLDLEKIDGYEVVANERFDVDLRAIGIAVKHLGIDISYSKFTFPRTIEPAVFVTSSPKPHD